MALIDRDKFLNAVSDSRLYSPRRSEQELISACVDEFIKIIDSQPIADTEPRVTVNEYNELANKFEELIRYATGGTMSKCSHSIDTILSAVSNYIDICMEDARNDKNGLCT